MADGILSANHLWLSDFSPRSVSVSIIEEELGEAKIKGN